jgi:hypothetical protein
MSNTTEMPQDSVLRRHWQASHENQANSAQSQSTSNSSTVPSSGFFSWLKSLFS